MIRLTLIGEAGRTAVAGTAPYFRVTAGAVWTRPGDDPLVRYADSSWQFLGEPWSGMRFEGKCRLVFGLARDPVGVSDVLDALSIVDCTLSANGVPFALYLPDREIWRGAGAETWWHSFRIESASLRPSSSESIDSEERSSPSAGAVPDLNGEGPCPELDRLGSTTAAASAALTPHRPRP